MTPPCKFCAKETVYVPLIIKGGNGDKSFHKFDVHYCYNCAAEYVKFGDANSIHIYTTINNKMYRWSVNDIESHPQLGTIWYIGEPGEPGVRTNRKLKLLKSFHGNFPQITPENIERKLRFMLLFL